MFIFNIVTFSSINLYKRSVANVTKIVYEISSTLLKCLRFLNNFISVLVNFMLFLMIVVMMCRLIVIMVGVDVINDVIVIKSVYLNLATFVIIATIFTLSYYHHFTFTSFIALLQQSFFIITVNS